MNILKLKSIVFSLMAIVMITVFLTSCEVDLVKPLSEIRDEVENTSIDNTENLNQNFKVIVKNEMLAFPTREAYDLAIDYLGKMNSVQLANWENKVGFVSLRSTTTIEEREEIGIYDDLLATLVNPNSLIEIGANIFEIDIIAETVSVTPVDSFNKMSSNQSNTSVYSIDDNVLDIIEGTDIPTENNKRGYCSRNKQGSFYYYFDHGRVKYKIVYQRSGILNSLVANLKKETHDGELLYNGPIQLKLQTNGTVENYWKNKTRKSNNLSYSDGGVRREYDFRPYYASRRLKAYSFKMKFTATEANSKVADFNEILWIRCNYNEDEFTSETIVPVQVSTPSTNIPEDDSNYCDCPKGAECINGNCVYP